jgi:hypothetical protein
MYYPGLNDRWLSGACGQDLMNWTYIVIVTECQRITLYLYIVEGELRNEVQLNRFGLG